MRLFPQWLLVLLSKLLLPRICVAEITDGNINFSYRVTAADLNEAARRDGGRGDGARSVFVKQALGHLKRVPQMTLERERMKREVHYLREARLVLGDKLAPEFLPRVLHFDPSDMFLIMEFLDGYVLLFEELFARGSVRREAALQLGEFMGRVHGRTATLGPFQSARRTIERAGIYWNGALREVQREHVYSMLFRESEKGRRIAKADSDLMGAVAYLKARYLGYSFGHDDLLALCHGDLHPGSVMLNPSGNVKVIDPEFCVFAPPGLDVGSLFSGFTLAHLFHSLPTETPPTEIKPPAGELALVDAMSAVWKRYESVLLAEGVSATQVARVGADAVGYALIEVLRTSLGFSGSRDMSRRISSALLLDAFQEVAIALARDSMPGVITTRPVVPTAPSASESMMSVPFFLRRLATVCEGATEVRSGHQMGEGNLDGRQMMSN